MARRASSSVNPLWIIGVFMLLILAISGGYFLYSRVGDPYRTIAPLDVEMFYDNSNSLRGNVYKITGTVDKYLHGSSVTGRLYSVEVDSKPVPVFVPSQFNRVNIQKGQRFQFKAKVDENGILLAEDLTKV